MSEYAGDPLARRFDHSLALVAYGLLFISVFTLWIPAVVAAGIAYTHKRGADWRTAGHFRFQLIIFFVSIATTVVGAGLLLTASGFGIGALVAWGSGAEPISLGTTAGVLALVGVLLCVLGAVWTIAASLWGAYRLATDRPIGQSAGGNPLDIR